ncbi:MAG TPA: methyltransferase domain-containing protein [Anaerolineae bacterium]|nr:methyltransferase domain-containing protein [Anaerolineae bacterium]
MYKTPLVHKSCEVCGSDESVPIFTDDAIGGTLVRCRICGMMFVNDITIDVTIRKIAPPATEDTPGWVEYRREAEAKRANFEKRYELLKPYLGQRILEIGCSAGFFLEIARDCGHDVQGIEPDPRYARYAREQLGLRVMTGLLDDVHISPGSFDTVCLFHVLEHVPSPARLLERISGVLRPGGHLVIEVPNIDNVWYRLLGRRWRQFFLGHYYFFAPNTLGQLLERNAYQVRLMRTVGRTISLRYFAGRLQRYNGMLGRAAESMVLRLGLAERTVTMNPGDIMLCVAAAPDLV